MMRRVIQYPLFIDIAGRRCLVVGGGKVAARKIRGLLSAGAAVEVIAPIADRAVLRMAELGKICFIERKFKKTDLGGVFMAFAATADPRVNGMVAAEARRRGVMVNVADDPERCDFFIPAVMRRGRLQIAVSTGGASPAMAAGIKRELLRRYGVEYADLLRALGAARRRLIGKIPIDKRAGVLAQFAKPSVASRFRGMSAREAREEVEKIISTGKQREKPRKRKITHRRTRAS